MGIRVAVVGGTRGQGNALAGQIARSGHIVDSVCIGSRDEAKAGKTAEKIRSRLSEFMGCAQIHSATNEAAVLAADLVVLAIPYEGLDEMLAQLDFLAGKFVWDVVVPLVVDGDNFSLQSVPEGSVSEHVQRLCPDAKVVAAMKTRGSKQLRDLKLVPEGREIVCGGHVDANNIVADLIVRIGKLRVTQFPSLSYARTLEALVPAVLKMQALYPGSAPYVSFEGIEPTALAA